MSDPIKLTDEMLDRVLYCIDDDAMMNAEALAFIAAIRAIRDAARAVVDSVEVLEVEDHLCAVEGDAVDALRDLLPEVKP